MKRTLLLILIPIILFSCSKKTSELELLEETKTPKVETTTNDEVVETKPLIVINAEDTLEIYVRGDGAPGMFLDTDGVLKGFYVDLEKAVMKEMGQKYELHSYLDAGPTVQKIRDGVAHVALSVPDLPDYRSFLNLSIPYEILNYVAIIQNDSELDLPENKEELLAALSGKKVGVQTRGHIYQLIRDYKEIEIIEYETTTVAMGALNRGELDAVPEVRRIMEHYSKLNNWDLKAVGEPIFSKKITTGFSKALDSSVVDRYNVALKSLIDSGYVANLYKEYFGE